MAFHPTRRDVLALPVALATRAAARAGDWSAIVAEASGQEVYFNAWAGSEPINAYIAWVAEQVSARHGITLEEAHRRMRPIHDATRGTLDWYCVDYWSRALALDIVALKRATRHFIAWLPDSRDFTARVRASGRRIVLVTNAHPAILAIKDAHLGVRRHFDAVYSSHDLGAPKEDGRYWQRLEERESLDCGRTLFADDTLPVLESARPSRQAEDDER